MGICYHHEYWWCISNPSVFCGTNISPEILSITIKKLAWLGYKMTIYDLVAKTILTITSSPAVMGSPEYAVVHCNTFFELLSNVFLNATWAYPPEYFGKYTTCILLSENNSALSTMLKSHPLFDAISYFIINFPVIMIRFFVFMASNSEDL